MSSDDHTDWPAAGLPPPPGPFGGHTGPVWAVAVTGDGGRIVTGGHDGTARIWNAASGAALATLTGHTGWVVAVAVTGDGGRVVTGGEDGTARIWDAASGTALATLTGHTGPVWAVAVTSDGGRIVTGGYDGTARIWDAASGTALATLSGHTGPVWAVAVTGDGGRIVTGGRDGTARIWDAASGAALATITGHTGWVVAVAVTGDGGRIVTGGDGTARIWDAASGTALTTLTGHTGPVWAVAVTGDGGRIVTGSEDGTARIWDAASGTALTTLTAHTGPVRAVAVTPDGHEIVSAGVDGTIRVWNLHSGVQVRGTTLPAAVSAGVLADPVSDEPSGTDLLDTTAEVHRLAGLLAASSTRPPLSVALLADWGAGKSSFMLQMQRHVDQLAALSRNNRGRTAYASNVRQVRFNAWHYSDDHVWVGIVEQLFAELVADGSAAAPDPKHARRRRTELHDEIERLTQQQARIKERLSRAAASQTAGRSLSWLASPRRAALVVWAALAETARDVRGSWRMLGAWLVVATLGVLAWWRLDGWLTTVAGWIAVGLGPAVLVLRQVLRVNATVAAFTETRQASLRRRDGDLTATLMTLREELAGVDAIDALARFLDDRAAPASWDRHRGLIGEVHGHLRQLSQLMRQASAQWAADPQGDPPIERVVLYIDDLDRCPPDRVVEVLAAVHLLLSLPLFIVVVGVDARWLRRSLEHHDHALFGARGTLDSTLTAGWASDPMDYLDKIFQIPFALRAMNETAAKRYIRSLLPTTAIPSTAPSPPGHPRSGPAPGPASHPTSDDGAPYDAAEGETPAVPSELRDLMLARMGHPAVTVPDLRPASLALQPHEIEFLAHLGILVPTPRAAKKLVNLYRLLRIGVPEPELPLFASATDSAPYRAAGLLLGIVVGVASLADTALTAILSAQPEEKLLDVLMKAACQEEQGVKTNAWSRLTGAVERLSRDPGLPSEIADYHKWAPEVARYSFHTRPLWARLTPQEQSRAADIP